jgi:hypothetical protein
MADNEIKAEIVLAGHRKPVQVRTTVNEIESEIEGERAKSLPVIKVVDARGREVRINANHIAAFYEYVEAEPLAAWV